LDETLAHGSQSRGYTVLPISGSERTAFTAPAARFATIRLGAYSESDHAGGWDGPARIRFAPVSPDNRPSRADREFPGRQIALLVPRAVLPRFGVRRSHRSGAKPTPRAGCRAGANGNSGPILRAKLFRRCRPSGFVAPVPSSEWPKPPADFFPGAGPFRLDNSCRKQTRRGRSPSAKPCAWSAGRSPPLLPAPLHSSH